jgi:hypothetical protein
VRKLEAVVGGICLGAWLLAALFLFAPGAGFARHPPARGLFPLAATLGWLAGNVYVVRSRARALGRMGLLSVYLGGPPGLVWLYWATLPAAVRLASPLDPLLALGVFAIFFGVPVSLRGFPRRG